MIARPALAAVTEALAGVTDPDEAVEILVARDLWPVENAPELWHTPGAVDIRLLTLASAASLGLDAVTRAESLAREAARELGYSTVWRMEWVAIDRVVRKTEGAAAELYAMGLELVVDYPPSGSVSLSIIVPPLPMRMWMRVA